MDERFPRTLTQFENEALLWILPEGRPGYNEYREYVKQWSVIARGRRGEGNYLLGPSGEMPDNESPLSQILALGSIVTESGELSVSIRERLDNQVEFEIVSVRGSVNVERFSEIRRWTLSSWLPSKLCPACEQETREVVMSSDAGRTLVLAICRNDRRLWVYDERTGVNHPIPVTNYYNELMLHKNIRDPKVALDSKRLFMELTEFSDRELTHAFQTYNQLHTKVPFAGVILAEEKNLNLFTRLKHALRRNTQNK